MRSVYRWLGVPAVVAVLLGAWWLRRTHKVVTVRGSGMAPALRDGDRVLVRRCQVTRLRLDDLVVFRRAEPGEHGEPVEQAEPRVSGESAARVEPGEPGEWVVRRVVAVPGHPVPRARVPALAGDGRDWVPAGSMVVVRDAPGPGHEGYVAADRLLGVVVRRMRRP